MQLRGSSGEGLRSLLSSLALVVGELEVDALDGASAVSLLKDVAVAKSSLSSCEALLARRIETSNAHLLTGSSSASAVVASVSGVSQREAAQTLATVNVVVDHAVLVRGSDEPGERCEVVGVGPLPVSTVQQLLNDCFLRVLVTKGRDVVAMGTEDRYLPSGVRASLDLRERVCSVRGCDVGVGLEVDHFREIRHGGKSATLGSAPGITGGSRSGGSSWRGPRDEGTRW